LIWTGRQIDAHEALRIGLVEEVVDTVVVNDDQEAHSNSVVDDRAIELAFHIARNAGPVAVRASKEAIDRGLKELDINDALEIERECYAKTLATRDRLEGLAAFKEGRSPIYKGC
jgi:enoyl-CoA hydratase/carnithine racemase